MQEQDPADDRHDAVVRLLAENDRLRAAIVAHHGQKADDRCWMDDDALYAAAGLPPCDHRVGDKAAMLANCSRYIERRCEGGQWPSYQELENEIARLRKRIAELEAMRDDASRILGGDHNSRPLKVLAANAAEENDRLRNANAHLRERVVALEARG